MNSLVGSSCELTETLTRTLWPGFKRRLAATFPGEEWVRAMYLLRAVRVSQAQVHLVATLPGNARIITGAQNRLQAMRKMLAPSFNLSLIRSPEGWEIAEAQRRYGIDMAPKPWLRPAPEVLKKGSTGFSK